MPEEGQQNEENEAGEEQESQEGETRIVNGRTQQYFGGKWIFVDKGAKEKPKTEKLSKPINATLTIGKLKIDCKATPAKFPKSDRRGYCLKIEKGQTAYGGGNIFVRADKEG